MAVQHVRALASFYQEYYAFTDIARDPVASPNNNTKVSLSVAVLGVAAPQMFRAHAWAGVAGDWLG